MGGERHGEPGRVPDYDGCQCIVPRDPKIQEIAVCIRYILQTKEVIDHCIDSNEEKRLNAVLTCNSDSLMPRCGIDQRDSSDCNEHYLKLEPNVRA